MTFKRINNLTGWLVCFAACAVYILTAEAGGSLWDCGEFVSCCFKLQIPHPPGAPLFVLLGRFFIVLFGNDPLTAAKAVNIMSALASGFTILFLFWSITHFARKIVQGNSKAVLQPSQLLLIMSCGVVGAMAYAFSDSFWYSAVEGEVYAMSSFFTALVFWAILKWENVADEPGADRWIVFIFFMMGLSIGVHLLNLLTLPALVMVYYFRKQPALNYPLVRKYFVRLTFAAGALATVAALISANSEVNAERGITLDATVAGLMLLGTGAAIGLLYIAEKLGKTRKTLYGGAWIFFVLSCVLVGVMQVGIIQYSVKAAGYFDVFFVNNLGLPFFSGFAFFFVLLGIGIWWLMRFANRRKLYYLRMGLFSLVFVLLGYSTYITTMIRSNADPGVDIFNVDNPISLNGYLGREQYGDFPLLYGQKFNAQPVDYKETGTKYIKGDKKYEAGGKDGHYVFLPEDKMVFPRMWDMTNDQAHADYYAMYMNIGKAKDGTYERGPDFADNVDYFLKYQTYFMYLRYFMWNFSGKQNDLEGMFNGAPRDGNWITGIGFIDNLMYGDQQAMPDSLKHNQANNKLFMLPLLLGLLGMVYQYKKRRSDALVSFLLFFFTGFAIVIYLNQPGFQPRERDYAYVGSFYAFSLWIGLGVLQVHAWLAKLAAFRLPVWRTGFAAALCFAAVPLLMAQQEWNDHDRSKKQLARDVAKDYLESCAPNAILFSVGDNDTYPLWYAQEVEGIRPDVRIVITSLLASDWYMNQLRYKINQSDPVDVIWSKDQVAGSKRDIAFFKPQPGIAGDRYYDLYDMMRNYVGSDDPSKQESRGTDMYPSYPVKKVAVPVDAAVVKQNGTVQAGDSILTALRFEIPKNTLYKNDMAVLNIIAANKWKRPIYFTMDNNNTNLGFSQYLRKDGLAYRLVPVSNNSGYNATAMYDNVMNKFGYGSANIPGVYFDEENRKQLDIIRTANTELAINLLDTNRTDEARKVLHKTDRMFLQENLAYGMTSKNNDHNRISLLFLQACYRANEQQLAQKVRDSVKHDLEQQIKYYDTLGERQANGMAYERNSAVSLLNNLEALEKMYRTGKPASPESRLMDTK
ncbi:glycosyltransferase family 117 protein [Deminuibacter soli]|uniref:glycosyltransferase family 117 protein n=1 Tax=Deminuibacter soli TaxID=2291815 RepID=UPI001FE38DC3|nr:DUF2723 domain-containing protein [Deminuibacter soli]